MRLFRTRQGFATNSSSTHSIILLKQGVKLQDTNDALAGQFGWDHFTAASKEAKALYFACLVRSAARRVIRTPYLDNRYSSAQEVLEQAGQELARVMITEVLGYVPAGALSEDTHVDHQSVFVLPTVHDGRGMSVEFAKDLWAFFSRDDVAILGGNDNGDGAHPDRYQGEESRIGLPKDVSWDVRVRREPWGWSMFNRDTGTRLHLGPATAGAPDADLGVGDSHRYRAYDGLEGTRDAQGAMRVTGGLALDGYPDKSATPELVDVKITDYCPFGCSYCYQGSTPAGKHAGDFALREIARELRKRQVWEVALGGGEPTMHPAFLDILQMFVDEHVIPNFTTRSTKWMENPIRARRIMSLVGGVAFSVDTAKDVERYAAAIADAGLSRDYNRHPFSFQYVVGTGDEHALVDVARAVKNTDHRLTLLGYKTTGRGNSLTPYEVNWAAVLKDLGMYQVSIDTALAQRSQRMLQGVDPRSYFTQEGKHSCYIDAVAGTVGPSSYAPELMQALAWSEWDAKDKKVRAFDELWKGW